jgi:hypothetical protein
MSSLDILNKTFSCKDGTKVELSIFQDLDEDNTINVCITFNNETYNFEISTYNERWSSNLIHALNIPEFRQKIPSMKKLSVPQFGITSNEISNFINKKNKKFKDFAQLKSGRDNFSKMKQNELENSINNDIIQKLKKYNFDDENLCKIYRWILRGLSFDDAVHKIKVDNEISENAKNSKKSKIWRYDETV